MVEASPEPERAVAGALGFEREDIESSIPARFHRVLRCYGARPALRTATSTCSYRDLGELIDRTATTLVSCRGAGPENVGLLLERDALMIAGIFGVLAAGKAYVPLDADYPLRRLEYMLANAGVSAILACDATEELARELAGGRVSVIDLSSLPERPADVELPSPTPDALAYILYTSGSTGVPKGVVQNHRNVLHFIRNYTDNLHLTCHDRMTLLSSYSFDGAVMAIFGAMLNGACLCPYDVARDGFVAVGPWILESSITVYHSTPTVLRNALAGLSGDSRFDTVRRVVLGGEAVVRDDVALVRRFFPEDCVLVNGLGPTESTVTLQHFIDRDTAIEDHSVPVGRPVSDTEVFLRAADGSVADHEGEIVFQSAHLALGYWNAPELTAKSFRSVPGEPGIREFRTGDLGRWRLDGTLEFVGRLDQQIKLNGVRIELGEVEAALCAIDGIEQAVVVAHNPSSGDTELVAYVVTVGGCPVDRAWVCKRLAETLPPSMCPSELVRLDVLPLTPTGKVDRRSLPAPPRRIATVFDTGPRTVLEDVWRDVLGVGRIDPDDDFFALGGTSLSAVRLCDGIAEKLGCRVPLVAVFEYRTLRRLEDAIQGHCAVGVSRAQIVPLTRGDPGGAHLFCICGLFLYDELALEIGSSHSVSGIFLPIEEQCAAEGAELPSLEQRASMYGDVIRRAQPVGPYRLAGLSFGGILAYELARQLRAQGEQVDVLAIIDSALPQTVSWLRRLLAHGRLLARRGPAYATSRVRRRWHSSQETNVPAELAGSRLNDEELAVALRRASIHARASAAYRSHMPSYDGDVIFFRALDTGAFRRLTDRPDCGWSRYVRGHVDTFTAPGSHSTMLQAPNVRHLADPIRAALDRAARESPGPGPSNEEDSRFACSVPSRPALFRA